MRPNHRTSTLFPYTTLFRSKNLAECAIDFLNPTVGRNRDHTVGNAFQNRFGEASASLQLTAVGLELAGHFVKATYQASELVQRADVHAIVQISLADLVGRPQQRRDGSADLSCQQPR